jgi:hypothetical protein
MALKSCKSIVEQTNFAGTQVQIYNSSFSLALVADGYSPLNVAAFHTNFSDEDGERKQRLSTYTLSIPPIRKKHRKQKCVHFRLPTANNSRCFLLVGERGKCISVKVLKLRNYLADAVHCNKLFTCMVVPN